MKHPTAAARTAHCFHWSENSAAAQPRGLGGGTGHAHGDTGTLWHGDTVARGSVCPASPAVPGAHTHPTQTRHRTRGTSTLELLLILFFNVSQ